MDKPIWFDLLMDLLKNYPQILPSIIGVMLAVMLVSRGLAELLGLFAEKTSTNYDDKMLMIFSKTAKFIGSILGWVGVGYPKSIK
jgi:uncharacterized protein YhhL (DUF1145 family)